MNPDQPVAPVPETPAPVIPPTPAPVAVDPTKGLSIASLILAFIVAPVGLVLGIVAMIKSKKLGRPNGLAIAAIILGALGTVGIIIAISVSIAAAVRYSDLIQQCRDLIPGSNPTLVADGSTLKCSYPVVND